MDEKYITDLKEEFNDQELLEMINALEPPILKFSKDINYLPYTQKLCITKFWEFVEEEVKNLEPGELLPREDILKNIIKALNYFIIKTMSLI